MPFVPTLFKNGIHRADALHRQRQNSQTYGGIFLTRRKFEKPAQK